MFNAPCEAVCCELALDRRRRRALALLLALLLLHELQFELQLKRVGSGLDARAWVRRSRVASNQGS